MTCLHCATRLLPTLTQHAATHEVARFMLRTLIATLSSTSVHRRVALSAVRCLYRLSAEAADEEDAQSIVRTELQTSVSNLLNGIARLLTTDNEDMSEQSLCDVLNLLESLTLADFADVSRCLSVCLAIDASASAYMVAAHSSQTGGSVCIRLHLRPSVKLERSKRRSSRTTGTSSLLCASASLPRT